MPRVSSTLGWIACMFLAACFAGQSGPFPLWKGRASLFCPPGNHAVGLEYDDRSHERCVQCEPGSYSDGSDAWSLEACHECGPGTYAQLGGATACEACEEGTFVELGGATACMMCAEGTFAEETGATSCDPP
jgi:hypothetical protein